ncbi:MAG: hypothetical protein BZY87_06135 [SAR202 cluster bacterium Io17-Chloro-G6]|nr:MAG: hypothetical protein BZY87_06135 [SAR202 cluster bacterium Io17-Chloro-G6]
MADLTAALDDSLSGRGRLVMLAGEPGIGKTRTALEVANQARDLGAQVLWGWCYDREGAPPYWPWVQPIRAYVQGCDAQRLQSEMGSGAADIADVIPEIRGKLPSLELPPTLEPEQARFRLFDSITTFLKNAAASRPLMLVLDDLHWADEPSLLLLEFLARDVGESPIMILGAYRDAEVVRGHPLIESLAQLSRSPSFRRRELSGLASEDVGPYVQAASGVEPSQALVSSLYAHTEGNPFFMSEVIRLLEERGDLNRGSGDGSPVALGIPRGVLEVIGQRLNRLSEDCTMVLTTAAVIGRQFEFNLLGKLSEETTESRLLELVEEALEARVIEELPTQGDRYQFSHALVQQTLFDGLSTSRRVRLHARIGDALETLHGDYPGDHAAELAYHFFESSTVLGPEKLVRYSLLAGERALATYAYEDALVHFERGLVARGISLSGTEAAPDEEAAALLFGLARARSGTVERHQLEEAFATLTRAFEYYVETGNIARAVAAAEFPLVSPHARIPGVPQLMARALALVPADSHEAGLLLSRYGGILGVAEFDYEGAQQACTQAIAIAKREGDVPLEAQTLACAAEVKGIHAQWQESVDNGLRAIELADGDADTYFGVLPRWWVVTSLLYLGDFDAARRHALVLLELAERPSTPPLLTSHTYIPITLMSCVEGDWKAGREYTDRGLKVQPLNPLLLSNRTLLEYETGESAKGKVYLERLIEATRRAKDDLATPARTSLAIGAVARITGVLDHLAVAEAATEAVLSNKFVPAMVALYVNAGLALLAVQNGDQTVSEEQYGCLLGHQNTMIGSIVSVNRLLGLLSQTLRNLDQALAHFDDAIAFCRKAGYRPELAWSCHDYAEALLEREDQRDQTKAVSLLDESLAISTELGMRPLLNRVVGLQERATAQPVPPPLYPDGLTQREVEVLRLVATGKTDREIAEELFISVATVSTHVRNLLNKTGAANRTEAPAYAGRQGLI